MFIYFTSGEEGKEILNKQATIIKNLKEVRKDFTIAEDQFWSCNAMVETINFRLFGVQERLDEIDKLCITGTPPVPDTEKVIFSGINDMTNRIRNNLSGITSIANDFEPTIQKIEDTVNKIKKKVFDKPAVNTINQKTDDILCKLKSIENTTKRISLDFWKLKYLIDKIDNELQVFSIPFKTKCFVKMTNISSGMTWLVTTIFIIIIFLLTDHSFESWKNHMAIVNACKNGTTTVSLGIILILAALAGIWSLAFTFIKSRIKIHEQDSRCFREFFQDM